MTHGLDAVETDPAAAPEAAAFVDRAIASLNNVIVFLSSIALVSAGLVLSYSVVTRYFLRWSTDWQDEMAVFLILGAVFMSSAAVQARRGHVAIEAVVALLPPSVNGVRLFLVDIATLAFCAFFAWKSWLLLAEAWTEGYRSASTWQPPLWIPYSLMTAGMALLSVQIALQLLGRMRTGITRG